MKTLSLVMLATACTALFAACGETDQSTASGNTNRGDQQAYQGANDPYVVKGWTPGNRTSWETQIRTRGQYQNEYGKVD